MDTGSYMQNQMEDLITAGQLRQEENIRLIEDYCKRTGVKYEKAEKLFNSGRIIEKSGSNSTYLVDNPDYLDADGNKKVKVRSKPTNITPKKKKRKR